MTANVLTNLGWLHGTFHLPPHQSLVDFLAPGVQVIKFTRVQLPQTTELIPAPSLRPTEKPRTRRKPGRWVV